MCTVAFSPNGKRIVSASFDDLVIIWVAATGAAVSSFERVRPLRSGDGGGFMLELRAVFALEVV